MKLFTISLCKLAVAIVLVATAAPFAAAHHGWSSFDTSKAYYLRGELTYVRWGNPHTEVRIRVDDTNLPEGFRDRALPPDADERYGRASFKSARPYDGDHEELMLVFSGPGWMSRWGLDRPLKEGEAIEVLGFLSEGDPRGLRPVMFWLSDGQGVWQQLTSFPTMPEPSPGL